jgi:hypothetical protein
VEEDDRSILVAGLRFLKAHSVSIKLGRKAAATACFTPFANLGQTARLTGSHAALGFAGGSALVLWFFFHLKEDSLTSLNQLLVTTEKVGLSQ